MNNGMPRRATGAALGVAALLCLTACSPPQLEFADPAVLAYVTEALGFMEEHGYYVDETWGDQVAHTLAATSTATSVSDTYGSLALAARAAGGSHSLLIRPPVDVVSAADTAMPVARLMAPTIAVVELPSFNSADARLSTAYADAANDAISTLAASASCGWIIDLYGNGGGNFYAMLAAAGAFLPQDTTLLSFIDRDASASRVSLDTTAALAYASRRRPARNHQRHGVGSQKATRQDAVRWEGQETLPTN